MMNRFVCHSLLVVLVCLSAPSLAEAETRSADIAQAQLEPHDQIKGQAKGQTKGQNPASQRNKSPIVITPEREAAALMFVELHHSELSILLRGLKKANPAEYQRAMRELWRTSERMAQLAERDPKHHELEMELWQSESRIQLLVAQLRLKDNKSRRATLETSLLRRDELKIELLKFHRAKFQERVDRIDELIKNAELKKRDQDVTKQVSNLIGDKKTKATPRNK